MTGTPQELIAAGKFNTKVPVLIGSNRDEWSTFIAGPGHLASELAKIYVPNMTESQFDNLLAYLGKDNIKAVKRLYDPSVYAYPADLGRFNQWWWSAMRVGTDNGIPFPSFPKGPALGHCSARRIAEQLVRGGTPSLYLYHFEQPLVDPHLVGHGMEIPFVFHIPQLFALGPGKERLSQQMTNYWVQFATSGTPNLHDATDAWPHWPEYSPDGDKANINFAATLFKSNISISYGLRGAACDFWDSLAAAERSASSMLIV